MKKILALLVLLPSTLFADGFIHPLKFNPSTDKEAVIKFIETDVKKTYSEIGMDDPSTLRMMEKENLNAFKELTKVKNAEILDNVINTYCKIGMCNYTTINMMYKEQIKASGESLSW